VQSLPQPPQFSASDAVLVSQPSSAPVEGVVQFAEPAAQLDTQSPPLHSTEATPAVAHARSQAPQWTMVSSSVCSQPSARSMLQSPQSSSQRSMLHSSVAHAAVA
jgi:hypothetical protein